VGAVGVLKYGQPCSLGSPLMLSDSAQIAGLGRSSVVDFRSNLLTPQRTVIAGAGIRHKDLVHLAEKHFEPHWPTTTPGPAISKKYDSTYVGGDASLTEPPMLPGGAPDPRNLVRSARFLGRFFSLKCHIVKRRSPTPGRGGGGTLPPGRHARSPTLPAAQPRVAGPPRRRAPTSYVAH
jgi:hypothetical protein